MNQPIEQPPAETCPNVQVSVNERTFAGYIRYEGSGNCDLAEGLTRFTVLDMTRERTAARVGEIVVQGCASCPLNTVSQRGVQSLLSSEHPEDEETINETPPPQDITQRVTARIRRLLG